MIQQIIEKQNIKKDIELISQQRGRFFTSDYCGKLYNDLLTFFADGNGRWVCPLVQSPSSFGSDIIVTTNFHTSGIVSKLGTINYSKVMSTIQIANKTTKRCIHFTPNPIVKDSTLVSSFDYCKFDDVGRAVGGVEVFFGMTDNFDLLTARAMKIMQEFLIYGHIVDNPVVAGYTH